MKIRSYKELFQDRSYPVLISTPQNIFYTIGFATAAKRPAQIGIHCVLMTPEHTWFFIPAGWLPFVQEQVSTRYIELVSYQGTVEQLARKVLETLGKELQLGFEQDGMELNFYLVLKREMERAGRFARWVNVSPHFKKLRLIKSEEEVDALRASAGVAKAAMEYAKTIIRPGMRECDVVAELEYFMRKRGSEGVPFTMKALAGENAVRTINLPGEYRIQPGDILLLDFGAVIRHYASDWTRSFAVGTVRKEQQELYELVWRIERACIEIIRPGVGFQELIDRAMQVIHGHPYARWFNPYLGHSIGMNSQEWPPIVPGAEESLEEHMVITIEPGIYVPGVGGVRIEDEILVTADGHEILTGLEEEVFLIAADLAVQEEKGNEADGNQKLERSFSDNCT